MAKVEKPHLPPPSPRRRGGLPYELSSYKGQLVARSRKKTPKAPPSPAQQAWIDNFRCIARASKYADPLARQWAQDNAPNTGWYWRDIIERALSGKLIVYQEEGLVLVPTANVSCLTPTPIVQNVFNEVVPCEVIWDNNAFWNPAVDPQYLTCKSPGLYLMGAYVEFSAHSAGVKQLTIADESGATITRERRYESTTQSTPIAVHTILYAHAGDRFRLRIVSVESGQTYTLQSWWIVAIATPELVGVA